MSKLPTLYALMERDGDSIEALDAAISRGYIEDQMEARRKVLEQHPGTEHSIAAYLPASEAIPKERVRAGFERLRNGDAGAWGAADCWFWETLRPLLREMEAVILGE